MKRTEIPLVFLDLEQWNCFDVIDDDGCVSACGQTYKHGNSLVVQGS